MDDNLIDLWLAVETSIPGYTIADALRDLNDECGTRYGHNKVSEWRRGVRQPGAAAQAYMRRVVIARALREALDASLDGYTDEQLDRLAALLSPPEDK
jgi:hypothetical protein